MAFFNCGGVRLYLGKPENELFTSRPIHYYRVADIEAAAAELSARGALFMDRPHLVHSDGSHELWMTALTDSEGNPVMLMEERPI
jgi:predicted enzyme related to lactoylglutathione lyase